MNKSYHICLSSKSEVLFRSNEDYYRAFNSYALALLKTNSTSLADAFMSNHFHAVVQTDNIVSVGRAFRLAYTMYFNKKYNRTGQLGNPYFFYLEIDGLYHHLAALSYVMRNPLHHGVSPNRRSIFLTPSFNQLYHRKPKNNNKTMCPWTCYPK